MKVDQSILYILYACTFISLAFIPKHKLRDASIIFLFQQAVTWFAGILAVGFNLLEYPVRELAKVNGTSFLYEFFLYPVITIFFCLYYPRISKRWKKIIYISTFSTGLTIPEVIIEQNTNLIKYLKWEWYDTWASVYITLFLAWIFYKWYFKLTNR
ncbi:CBO0543 family protein [Neobacillus drentensis]|uniref:CBO0543 family protein n=1 Tax=Neobacillus drentensis TaxID=220684 RepID=UPI00285927E2|nr:CBO0543 family protein [Neobacillus drentensis]MDR7236596.1 ABC-type multidrug transport system permease subunit [Neobacillus drentensis]